MLTPSNGPVCCHLKHLTCRCIYGSTASVTSEASCFRAVRAFFRAFQTLLTLHLEKYWTYFHQTFSIDAILGKDEGFKFQGQKVKVLGHAGPSVLENALLALIMRCLENYWIEFHQTFSVEPLMHFGTWKNASVLGSKVKSSSSQHDQGPRRRRHGEL